MSQRPIRTTWSSGSAAVSVQAARSLMRTCISPSLNRWQPSPSPSRFEMARRLIYGPSINRVRSVTRCLTTLLSHRVARGMKSLFGLWRRNIRGRRAIPKSLGWCDVWRQYLGSLKNKAFFSRHSSVHLGGMARSVTASGLLSFI